MSATEFDRHRFVRQYRVTLACGCAVNVRDKPMNWKVTYPCPSGLGHGYRVAWVSVMNRDNSIERPNTHGEPWSPEPRGNVKSEPLRETVTFDVVNLGDRVHFATASATMYGTQWRDGTVIARRLASLYVRCDDGTTASLTRTGWAGRMVQREV